jgi:hypothetical protein
MAILQTTDRVKLRWTYNNGGATSRACEDPFVQGMDESVSEDAALATFGQCRTLF